MQRRGRSGGEIGEGGGEGEGKGEEGREECCPTTFVNNLQCWFHSFLQHKFYLIILFHHNHFGHIVLPYPAPQGNPHPHYYHPSLNVSSRYYTLLVCQEEVEVS